MRSFYLDPDDISSLSVGGGQSGTLVKQQDSHDLDIRLGGTKSL